MLIQLALINQETGEPIYDVTLNEDEILAAIDNAALRSQADTMRQVLARYSPKIRQPRWQAEQPEVAPTEGPKAQRAGEIIDTDGDLLSGSTNLGY